MFNVSAIPQSTQLRSAIDNIPSTEIEFAFKDFFLPLQRGKQLEQYKFISGKYLVVLDGVQIIELVKGGRARWKIENEAFNTLKNQAYKYINQHEIVVLLRSHAFCNVTFLSFKNGRLRRYCSYRSSSLKRTLVHITVNATSSKAYAPRQ